MKNIREIMETGVMVKKGTLFLWATVGFFAGVVTMFIIALYTMTGMI